MFTLKYGRKPRFNLLFQFFRIDFSNIRSANKFGVCFQNVLFIPINAEKLHISLIYFFDYSISFIVSSPLIFLIFILFGFFSLLIFPSQNSFVLVPSLIT